MRYSILGLLVFLFAGLSCRQLSPKFANEHTLEMACLDSLQPEISKIFFYDVCLTSSNKFVARIEAGEPQCVKAGFPGDAVIYLTNSKTGDIYDSLHVRVNMPEGLAPMAEPLLRFGSSMEQVLEYEKSLGFEPQVNQSSVKSSRLFYGNHARGLYYNFDETGSLRQIVVPFLFDMLADNKAQFAEYLLVQGLPAAELGGLNVSLLYGGEAEKDYQTAYESMRSGTIGDPLLSGRTAVCYAFTQGAEPALIYFPVEDLYTFPKYSYDLW